MVAADHAHHFAPPDRSPGIEGVREFVRAVHAEWPDLRVTIEDQVAEGDKVVTRWTVQGTNTQPVTTPFGSIAPTGKQISMTGMDIHRVDGGKVVETWSDADYLGLMLQIGAVPTPALAMQ